MAGQSTVINNFETVDFPNVLFDETISLHTNEKTGDHPHVLFQDQSVITASGERVDISTLFDNSFASGPGLTFNAVTHLFPVEGFQDRETLHFNNHAADHSLQENTNTLLGATQQPQADLTNLQQAAADTVSTHDAGLQPDLHAANVQASAFHLV